MTADRTDPLRRFVVEVHMIDHVGLVLAFLGTSFAEPSAPLDLLKVRAVIDSICKRQNYTETKAIVRSVNQTNQQVKNRVETIIRTAAPSSMLQYANIV